jgi:hypothetical protein
LSWKSQKVAEPGERSTTTNQKTKSLSCNHGPAVGLAVHQQDGGPHISMLRRFAKAMDVPLAELVAEKKGGA